MAVLIVCDPADIHVSAIGWALEHYGVRAIRWHPAPPWAPAGSIRFESGSVDYRFAAAGGEIAPRSIDAVWMRRWPNPVCPPGFGDGEKIAARDASAAFHAGLLELLPRDILWANPLRGRASASFKLRQLAAAVAVGLPIPRTLVTDDGAQAREFAASGRDGQMVYKPFHAFFWERPGHEVYHTVTTPVGEADFDDPQSLLWSPGIFQTFIAKAFELRVAVFGRTCVAAKIFDQDPIDWRTRQFDMKVAPYALPEAVELRLHALMERLGLTMGMADFIVTPEGEHIFLEVNEQGQFLWAEQMCPDLPLLDTCARFLAGGDPGFDSEPAPGSGPLYGAFLATAFDTFREEERRFFEAGGTYASPTLKDDGAKQKEPGAD